jgi:Holliday junction resolvasome RuvABC endonuclease subunit
MNTPVVIQVKTTVADLSQFRIGEPDGSPMAPLPILDIRHQGKIIAFDQSLSNTGYVVLDTSSPTFHIGPLKLMTTGMLKAKNDLKGHENTLFRGMDLFWEIQDVCRQWRPDSVIFETPPVGGRMARPESSLLAALSLRLAAIIENPFVKLVMISRQQAAKRWTGNGNADKRVVRAALDQVLTTHEIARCDGPWNEHVYDALSLGLLYMEGKDGS